MTQDLISLGMPHNAYFSILTVLRISRISPRGISTSVFLIKSTDTEIAKIVPSPDLAESSLLNA